MHFIELFQRGIIGDPRFLSFSVLIIVVQISAVNGIGGF